MTEQPTGGAMLSEASSRFLRQQVLLFEGYALALAQDLGLTAEEAGRRFWQGLSSDRPSREVDAAELERIAAAVAEDMELIYGNAVVERAGTGWRVITSVTDQDQATLDKWGVSLRYMARWLAEIQRHEGDQIRTNWTTRLDGNDLIQELTPSSDMG